MSHYCLHAIRVLAVLRAVSCATVFLSGVFVSAGTANAETVLLSRGDDTFGLGWLFLDGSGKCRVATPRHVIETADGALVAPDLIDRFGRQHPTATPLAAPDADLDLAFLSVGGRVEKDGCSLDRLRATPLQSVIDSIRQADLGVVTPGERQIIAVTPRAMSTDEGGGQLIAFSPASGDVSLQKGMSGGTVTYNGRPVAMLLEVDPDTGTGVGLRYDVIAAEFQKLVSAGQAGQAVGKPVAAISGGDLVLERGVLHGRDSGLSTFRSGQSPLEVSPDRDRVEFTYDVAPGTVLKGLRLQGSGFAADAKLIVEVDNARAGFVPGARCLLSPDTTCNLSPRRADRLRIILTGSAADRFSIAALTIF